MELWNASGEVIARRGDSILAAVDALETGRIVAVKGLGGFHLVVDAANEDSVQRLRTLKHREEKPFALMVPSVENARELCFLNDLEERAITAPEAPIVLLSHRPSTEIAPSVAPANPYLGVMLPYTPLHHILLRLFDRPIVATSGNHSDEPIVIDEHDALRRLSGIADLFLVHDRPIRRHVDDSIVRILLGREQILRRARGFAPLPLKGAKVSEASVPTLAGGAHMKNAVALTAGGNIFVSQHIGDLNTKQAFDAFQQVTEDLQRLYDTRVQQVAVDMHPDYASTRYISGLADSYGINTVRVQHHWAHVLSCLAENEVEVPALGVAWDGTGYGNDGTIWGGEFLLGRDSTFTRAAHFRTFPLPGGDAAARNPEYAAYGVVYEIFKTDAFAGKEPPLLRQMLEKNFRSPQTSSVGRLFDAVAYLTGVQNRVSFEGQAAMQLEFAASAGITALYDYIIHTGQPCIVDWEPMIRQILDDVRRGTAPGTISAIFHNTLADIVVQVAQRIAEPRVALTGGCFQNRYLAEQTVQRLAAAGFCPYWHQRVPPNDGGIALGQAIAAQRMIGEVEPCVLQSRAK
jgi:hydrogenase maturation protein HypF